MENSKSTRLRNTNKKSIDLLDLLDDDLAVIARKFAKNRKPQVEEPEPEYITLSDDDDDVQVPSSETQNVIYGQTNELSESDKKAEPNEINKEQNKQSNEDNVNNQDVPLIENKSVDVEKKEDKVEMENLVKQSSISIESIKIEESKVVVEPSVSLDQNRVLQKIEKVDSDCSFASEKNQTLETSTYDEEDDLPLRTLIKEKNLVSKTLEQEQQPVASSSSKIDENPVCSKEINDYTENFDSDSDSDDSFCSKTEVASDWCICKNYKTANQYTKMCDSCLRWYHMDCVGSEETRKKLVRCQRITEIDFVCLICRNDTEMIDKFDKDIKAREQREKKKSEADMNLMDSDGYNSDRNSDDSFNHYDINNFKSIDDDLEDIDFKTASDSHSDTEHNNQTSKQKKKPLLTKTLISNATSNNKVDKKTKTLDEKLQSVRERCKEPNHTKLIGTNDLSSKLGKSTPKPIEKISTLKKNVQAQNSPQPNSNLKNLSTKVPAINTPKQNLNQNQFYQKPSGPNSASKITTSSASSNSTSKITISSASSTSTTFANTQSNVKKITETIKPSTSKASMNKSPVEERKTKFCSSALPESSKHRIPQITVQKKFGTIDREDIRNKIFTVFKERLNNANDIKMTTDEIEKLCFKIEENYYAAFPNTNIYFQNLKTFRMNITDKNNNTFFRKILNGQIKPEQLPNLKKEDMKDDNLKKQDKERDQQNVKGYIEQSKVINESLLNQQRALKNRKGLDDDLSTLTNHGINYNEDLSDDLNNNNNNNANSSKASKNNPEADATTSKKVDITLDKSQPLLKENTKNTEILPEKPNLPTDLAVSFKIPDKLYSNDTTSQHGSHQFDVGCKICTGQQVPAQVISPTLPQPKPIENFLPKTIERTLSKTHTPTEPIPSNEKKRKHDSDFESDSEEETTSKLAPKSLSSTSDYLPKIPKISNSNIIPKTAIITTNISSKIAEDKVKSSLEPKKPETISVSNLNLNHEKAHSSSVSSLESLSALNSIPRFDQQPKKPMPETLRKNDYNKLFNINEILWSGSLSISASDATYTLNIKSLCINDVLSPNISIVKEHLSILKTTLLNNNIKTLASRKMASCFKNIWNDFLLNKKNYIVVRLDPNISEKSQIFLKSIKNPLPIETIELYAQIFDTLHSKNLQIQMDIPDVLKHLVQDIYITSLKSKSNTDTIDPNLKEKYQICVTRNSDFLLGLIVLHQSNEQERLQPNETTVNLTTDDNKRKNIKEPLKPNDIDSKLLRGSISVEEQSNKPNLQLARSNSVRDPRIRLKPTTSQQISTDDSAISKNTENSKANLNDLDTAFSHNLPIFLKGILETVKQTSSIDPDLDQEILSNIVLEPSSSIQATGEQQQQATSESIEQPKINSSDLYKLKKKRISRFDMPFESDQGKDSEGYLLVKLLFQGLAERLPLSENEKQETLFNLSDLSSVKELNQIEREKLKKEFQEIMPDFIEIIMKTEGSPKNDFDNLKENLEPVIMDIEMDNNEQSNENNNCEKIKESKTSPKISDNTNKLQLPPAELWQGPSKEAFIELLKLHKHSREQKKSGATRYDLSYENKNWTLEKKDFKEIDRRIIIENNLEMDLADKNETENYQRNDGQVLSSSDSDLSQHDNADDDSVFKNDYRPKPAKRKVHRQHLYSDSDHYKSKNRSKSYQHSSKSENGERSDESDWSDESQPTSKYKHKNNHNHSRSKHHGGSRYHSNHRSNYKDSKF